MTAAPTLDSRNAARPAAPRDPKLRVLLLSNSHQVGGGNCSLLTHAAALSELGHEVHVAIPGAGPMADECAGRGMAFVLRDYEQPSWKSPVRLWRDMASWRSLFEQFRPTIIHANDLMNARCVSLPARRARIPVVCHVRFGFSSPYARWVLRRLPKPQAFIFNSQALRDEVGDSLRRACPRSAQHVVHNGVDLARFALRGTDPLHLRIGILANLTPVKGHGDFIEMAALLARRRMDAECWIIGEDLEGKGYRQELEAHVARLGLESRIRFLGHRRDVPELLRELQIVVCASHVEPFGRCLIEAMACGLPVVATRVGGIPEVVADGQTGLLVPPRSPQDLADAVEKLARDAELRAEMGRAGRRRAERLFSTHAHTAAVLDVYRAVLGHS